jgi:PKHD-type hydroxylase
MEYSWWTQKYNNVPYATIKNIFSNEEIEKIIEIGKSETHSSKTDAMMGDKVQDFSYRKCKLSWIRSDIRENEWIFQKITDAVNLLNSEYYKFDIDLIQNLQFTEYTSEGDFYGKHLDMGEYETRPRKISFSIQLSKEEEYTGGDLRFYYSDTAIVADKEMGTMTSFPSYILHEVLPVTEGTRYALVGWVCGPKFR